MILSLISSLITSLLLTIIIETTISLILGIRKQDIITVICTNICTNPVVVYISNCLLIFNLTKIYNFTLIIMEICVVIIEGLIYKKHLAYYNKSPWALSLICNFISFSIGVIFFHSFI